MKYKSSFNSLEECLSFIKKASSSAEYSKDEKLLNSCYDYLNEYKTILQLQQSTLFKVKCINSNETETLLEGFVYRVVEETDKEYFIKEKNKIGKYNKSIFVKLEE